MSSVAITIRSARAVAWRHLYKWVKMPANFIPTVMFPLVFFMAFAGGLSAVGDVPGFNYPAGYTAYQFCFVLLQSAALGGVATGFSIAGDFESGFVKRIMVTCPNRASILLGYMMSTFVRWVLIITFVTIVALVSGMDVMGSPAELVAMYLLAALLNLVGTCWASGVMFRGRSMQYAPAMQVPIFILIFLAPVYVPLDLLTGWIHTVATYNPITYLLEATRGLLAGYRQNVALATGLVLVLLAFALTWSLSGLRRATRAG